MSMIEIYYQNALALKRQGFYNDALAAFDKLINIKPDYLTAVFERGAVLERLGRKEEAQKAYAEVATRGNESREARFCQALLLEAKGLPTQALAVIEQVLADDPTYAPALFSRLQFNVRHGNPESILQAANRLYEQQPNESFFLFYLGDLYAYYGFTAHAINCLKSGLKLERKNKAYKQKLAGLYLQQDQYDNAYELYSEMLDRQDVGDDILYNYCIVALKVDHLAQAEQKWSQLQKANSTSFYVKHLEAKILLYKHHYTEALDLLDNLIGDYPNVHDLYYDKAKVLFNLGREEDSLTTIDHANKLSSSYRTHYEKGLLLLHLERWEEAIKELVATLRMKSEFPDAYVALAVAYEHLGKLEEVVNIYQQAIHLRPDSSALHHKLFVLLVQLNRSSEAFELLERITEIDNQRFTEDLRQHFKGSGNANLNRYDKVIRELEKKLEANPKHAKTHYFKAMFYCGLRDKQSMLHNLSRAFALNGKLREEARNEEVFERFWNDPDFSALLEVR